MIIELHPKPFQLGLLKIHTRNVHVGECVEAFGELWRCHKKSREVDSCMLCDFHKTDVPCHCVSCCSIDRKDGDSVYFTNFK